MKGPWQIIQVISFERLNVFYLTRFWLFKFDIERLSEIRRKTIASIKNVLVTRKAS